MSKLSKKIASVCFAIALTTGFMANASSVYAGDGCYAPNCVYKTVTTWVTMSVPYERRVTLYKPCGTPYSVWKTYYRTVEVPVSRRVKVCY